MRFYKLITAIIILGSILSGCSIADRWVYRPDINQGNYITQTSLSQLKVGQTKEQVAFIMGTPMLKSVFSDNSWYYVYRTQPRHESVSQHTVSVFFDSKGFVREITNTAFKNSKPLNAMDDQKIAKK